MTGRETTAPTTGSVSAAVNVGYNRVLYFDGNQKITAGNGTFANPVPNAFSLLQIQDCPQSTPTCRKGCYVHNLETAQPYIHAMYAHNSKTIREILNADMAQQLISAAKFASYVSDNCKGGFRWHVSGDVFSRSYAKWITNVCTLSPNVGHWIYTRSFMFLPWLLDATNLEVNLSADRDNYDGAKRHADLYNLRLCYYALEAHEIPDDLPEGSVIFPDYKIRGRDGALFATSPYRVKRMVCPVDVFGKTEHIRCGPCRKCMK